MRTPLPSDRHVAHDPGRDAAADAVGDVGLERQTPSDVTVDVRALDDRLVVWAEFRPSDDAVRLTAATSRLSP